MNTTEKYLCDHIAKGNKKLPTTTWIFNSGTATECPSKALGLCQAGDDCYALKAEVQYPACKPYRERQLKITKDYFPSEFSNALIKMRNHARNKDITFRFNESGDFENQAQLDWFVSVCDHLNEAGIKCYGYTARTDMNLSPLLKVASVMVSNDKGGWVAKGANRFKIFTNPNTAPKQVCAGDCRICKMCLSLKGGLIGVEKH